MPGPGSKQKSKKTRKKPSASAGTPKTIRTPSDLESAVADIVEWGAVEDVLITLFELPDISTRSGLRQVHKNFDEVCQKLGSAYNQFQANGKIAAGIVGILTQMSADAILRDRLIEEKDLLTKIFALLGRPELTLVAVQCLSAITHHGGQSTRLRIAKRMPVLLRLLEENSSNAPIAELTISVLSHSAATILETEKPPDPRFFDLMDVPRIIRLLIAHIAKPSSTLLLVGHASDFFVYAPWSCAKELIAYPPAMNYTVALTRSSDFETRWSAMLGLLRTCRYNAEMEDANQDPNKLIAAAQRGAPDHLSDAIVDYGREKCELTLILSGTRDYQTAMMQLAQDHDFVKLGRLVARLILSTEYSISDGYYQTQDLQTGSVFRDNFGLPFSRYIDALPMCASALRRTGNAADIDQADVTDCKNFLVRGQHAKARQHARQAAERNPTIGYFYYVQTLGAPEVEGLRYAKKGLKCPNLTGYVRFALLYRGMEHATSLAMMTLQKAVAGERSWDEGIALLVSAFEDSKTFIEEAPPDTRSLSSALYHHAILTMILKGSEISPDMSELRENVKKLDLVDDFTRFFGRRVTATQLRKTRSELFQRMEKAWKEWGDIITRHDSMRERRAHVHQGDIEKIEKEATGPEIGLEKWFAKMGLGFDGEGEGCEHRHDVHHNLNEAANSVGEPAEPLHPDTRRKTHRMHPRVNPNTVELYRCTWCKNPSAALKKCSGCGKTRYCDSSCQKLHWTGGHREECRKAM